MELNFHFGAGSEPSRQVSAEQRAPRTLESVTQTLKNWSDIGPAQTESESARNYLLGNICSVPRQRWRRRQRFDAPSPKYPSDVLFVGHEMWSGHDNNKEVKFRCRRISREGCGVRSHNLISRYCSSYRINILRGEVTLLVGQASSCDWWVHYLE